MTSDDYRPCVAIYPRISKVRQANVRYARLMTVDQALTALHEDHAAYVATGDAETVLARWQQARGAAHCEVGI